MGRLVFSWLVFKLYFLIYCDIKWKNQLTSLSCWSVINACPLNCLTSCLLHRSQGVHPDRPLWFRNFTQAVSLCCGASKLYLNSCSIRRFLFFSSLDRCTIWAVHPPKWKNKLRATSELLRLPCCPRRRLTLRVRRLSEWGPPGRPCLRMVVWLRDVYVVKLDYVAVWFLDIKWIYLCVYINGSCHVFFP